MIAYLSPAQLGFGVPHGAEAAIHATWLYLSQPPPSHIHDFSNAFNSIRRDKMLVSINEIAPE